MKVKRIFILLMIVICNNTWAQSNYIFYSGFEFVPKLNDTGITIGGNSYEGNNETCTSDMIFPQDCDQGRDATHNDDSDGAAGFSFTKLDAKGVPLVDQNADYQTNPWACVRDNVTGLVWEVKTDDGGAHDKDNTYRWGGVSAIGLNHPDAEGTYYDDWNTLILFSNVGKLCGFEDWRVPTLDELFGLVHLGRGGVTIDINYFPYALNIGDLPYWTATPTLRSSSSAHGVTFDVQEIAYLYRPRNLEFAVRLVRGLGQ